MMKQLSQPGPPRVSMPADVFRAGPGARSQRVARRVDRQRFLAKLRNGIDPDGFFAFALFLPMLFISGLGTLGAAIFSCLAVIYAARRFSQLGEIVAPRAFILVIPFLALVSTLWSQAPGETLKYSIEFAMTVGFGLLLSAAPRPKAVLWGMFFAFAFYVLAALAFGQVVDVGNDGDAAFSGLTASKNLLADIGSTGLLISLACFVAGIEDRQPFRAFVALGVAAAQSYALIEARSAGALLGVAPAIAVFIFLLALRHARLAMRMLAILLAASASALAAFAYGNSAIEDAMTLFDKDPTLTGRTYLWERASDFIAENPLLGKGFNAFWLRGNPDAEGLWQYAGITTREGFSFHNTAIEILVHLGWVGLFVLGVTALIGAALLIHRVTTRPTLALCFWSSILVYDLVRMPIETIGITPFYFSTVLLFAAFGSSFAARRVLPAKRVVRGMPRREPFLRPALQPGRYSL
jgi:exopolysaccharide production protein ExoQ